MAKKAIKPNKPIAELVRLRKMSDELTKMVMHPGTFMLLEEMQKGPKEERLAKAEKLGNIEQLRVRGVPIPKNARLSLRVFEDPGQANVTAVGSDIGSFKASDDTPTVCVSVGWIICLTAGESETFTSE